MHACDIRQYLIRQNVFYTIFRQILLSPIFRLIRYIPIIIIMIPVQIYLSVVMI